MNTTNVTTSGTSYRFANRSQRFTEGVNFQLTCYFSPGVSQPFDPSKITITSWNAEAIASFLRILIGCVIGTSLFLLILKFSPRRTESTDV